VSRERAQKLQESGRRLHRSVSAWLSLVALVATLWLLVSLLLVHSGGAAAREGAALLPPTTCPNGQRTALPGVIIEAGAANIRYNVSGCNKQSVSASQEITNTLISVQPQLESFGFLTPPQPFTIEVLTTPRAGNVQSFLSADGGPSALILSGANLGLYTLQGYTQLALGYALPGLSAHSRARLASAFAVLATGDTTRQAIAAELADSDFTDGSEGLYDAWLGARFGATFLRDALSGCQQTCSWPQELDKALHARGLSANTLEGEFADTAVAFSQRGALLASLQQP
jgi:hypothetical protein